MFIVGALQHIKIGDLSMSQSGIPLTDDVPSTDLMDIDDQHAFPSGVESGMAPLSRDEERSLVRDSTSGFAGTLNYIYVTCANDFQIGWHPLYGESSHSMRTFQMKVANEI